MDYNILKSFRIFYSDYVLLYDAIQEYHRARPSDKSLKEFTSGVAAMIEVESSIEKVSDIIVVKKEGPDSEYTALGLVLEVLRSVVIEFIADELSQVGVWSPACETFPFLSCPVLSIPFTICLTSDRTN